MMTAMPSKRYSGHARPQKKMATQEHLEKRSEYKNVDDGLQVQLEEDADGST